MKKLRDWSSRLQALFAERLERPFEWGVHDCALFAADAVIAQTGVDPASSFRGTYRGAREAIRALRDAGGPLTVVGRSIGPAVPVELAQRGDIGAIQKGRHIVLAVCNGHQWMAPASRGLEVAADKPIMAWRSTCLN